MDVQNSQISEDTIATMARAIGLVIPTDRLPVVAEGLSQLLARAAEVMEADLGETEPEVRFDARWPEVTG